MIKNALVAVGASARALFRNWRALILVSLLYLALLACVYLFFATGEATVWQLVLSALTAVAAPLLLFILEAAVAHFAHAEGVAAGALFKRALRDFWKLIVVSLPVIALAVLAVYLLNRLSRYLPQAGEAASQTFTPAGRAAGPPPTRWQDVFASSLWLLVLGVVLPLLAAHLWLSAARDGLKWTLRHAHRVAARAFAPPSVLVYAVGLLVFGLMPYLVIYATTPVESSWGELSLFGLRLALAFAFTLWGWAVTLGALARLDDAPRVTAAEAGREELPAEPAPSA